MIRINTIVSTLSLLITATTLLLTTSSAYHYVFCFARKMPKPIYAYKATFKTNKKNAYEFLNAELGYELESNTGKYECKKYIVRLNNTEGYVYFKELDMDFIKATMKEIVQYALGQKNVWTLINTLDDSKIDVNVKNTYKPYTKYRYSIMFYIDICDHNEVVTNINKQLNINMDWLEDNDEDYRAVYNGDKYSIVISDGYGLINFNSIDDRIYVSGVVYLLGKALGNSEYDILDDRQIEDNELGVRYYFDSPEEKEPFVDDEAEDDDEAENDDEDDDEDEDEFEDEGDC